ncbi:MAG: MBL fold metallo-hydrolase [Euryarchaeota archaeon]|nr:MBL fold metallo-hydrolase [Euryarchaeota archaeon]
MAGGEYPTEIPLPGHAWDFFKWRREHKRIAKMHEERGETLPAVSRNGAALLRESVDTVTWSGHASVITRLDGKTVLGDPVWSNRIALIMRRMTPVAPAWEAVPPPNLITISHNHYDHLDNGTMKRVRRETPVAVPLGVGGWFRKRGFRAVHEFNWWETKEIDGLQVSFVPSRHFSGRTLWDRNKSLFGGWVVQGDRHGVYHSGDTGYFAGFREVGDRFPGLDVACLPIGAYLPPWIMKEVHTDPDEAGKAFVDVKARRMLPIHWGTFRLSDEAMDEPPARIRAFFENQKLAADRLLLPDLGEVVRLDGSATIGPSPSRPRP